MAARTTGAGSGVTQITGRLSPDEHRVMVLEDHHLLFPELYMNVYILGPAWEERAFAPMFSRAKCKRADCPEEADLVVFTGGTDVDPLLYGAKPHHTTDTPDTGRDQHEMEVYLTCMSLGIPMLGICRGAQFLHVMNGGVLYQHVDCHTGDHKMLDLRTKEIIEKISSVHHQMVKANVDGGMEIIGTVAKSTKRFLDNNHWQEGTHVDIEAFFYRDTCCIGIQGHPEYSGYNFFQTWALQLISDCCLRNPDMAWNGSALRMKPDVLRQRDIGLGEGEKMEPLLLPPALTGSYHSSKGK